MSDKNKKSAKNPSGLQEGKLSGQSEVFLRMLTERGLLDNPEISDDLIRQATKARKRKMYHNTLLMLQNYRDITWALKCFPSQISDELDKPMTDLDTLLSLINAEIGLGNTKLENRLVSVQKSRLLLDRFNEALTMLREKPENGKRMYECLFMTYLAPKKMSHTEIIYKMDISSRHYYRLRKQAINILSIRLWAAPTGDIEAWLDVLTLLEAL